MEVDWCCVLCIGLLALVGTRAASDADQCDKLTRPNNETVPYAQIYPGEDSALKSWETPTSDGKSPLYFALILSFGGQYLSSGAIPGVQVALDQINSDTSILPGYELRYTLIESVVSFFFLPRRAAPATAICTCAYQFRCSCTT